MLCDTQGTFRFKVLSFGLANTPALFQRLMDLVLSGLTWEVCLVYLDDVIVMSRSFDEQLFRLSTVFDRLKVANLKLKPSKCKLFQREVVFLGHTVSGAGIAPDSQKIQAVSNWPRPRNLTETRAFVGLASYYRNFVPDFAAIARPLLELTRKHHRFEWTDKQEEAFLCLKRRLTEAPVLAAPRDEGLFCLDTDASDFALGAILQQEQGGELRVIGYASRALSDAERNYCTTRKELLGVIYGLKQYRQFLLARENFVIRTDHAALTSLMRTPEPLGQQARWLDLLAEYNFQIRHRAGVAHRNCDALSRRPCERDTSVECKQCRPKVRASCFTVSLAPEPVPPDSDKLIQVFRPVGRKHEVEFPCDSDRPEAKPPDEVSQNERSQNREDKVNNNAPAITGSVADCHPNVSKNFEIVTGDSINQYRAPASQGDDKQKDISGEVELKVSELTGCIAGCVPNTPSHLGVVAGNSLNQHAVSAPQYNNSLRLDTKSVEGLRPVVWGPSVPGTVLDTPLYTGSDLGSYVLNWSDGSPALLGPRDACVSPGAPWCAGSDLGGITPSRPHGSAVFFGPYVAYANPGTPWRAGGVAGGNALSVDTMCPSSFLVRLLTLVVVPVLLGALEVTLAA